MAKTAYIYIKYYILGALMWGGWLIYPALKVGFFRNVATYKNAYGGLFKAIVMAARTSKAYMSNNVVDLITPFILNFVVYLIVFIIVAKYRASAFAEFIDDDTNYSKEELKWEKEQKENDRMLTKMIFDKDNVPE